MRLRGGRDVGLEEAARVLDDLGDVLRRILPRIDRDLGVRARLATSMATL
jgi:hypothetical protein